MSLDSVPSPSDADKQKARDALIAAAAEVHGEVVDVPEELRTGKTAEGSESPNVLAADKDAEKEPTSPEIFREGGAM